MKKLLFVPALILFCLHLSAQTTVMVIPFYKKGEKKEFIIEDDQCYRMIETQIKSFFIEEAGYQPIDYLAIVRRLEITDVITRDAKAEDIVTMLVQNANPNVYVVADIERGSNVNSTTKKEEFYMLINLTAHWTFNGKTLAAALLRSGFLYYDHCDGLSAKTFQNRNDDGQKKITVFVKKIAEEVQNQAAGIPASLEFFLSEDSNYDFFTPLTNGEILLESIRNWVKTNAMNNQVAENISEKYIKFSEVMFHFEDKPQISSSSDVAVEFFTFLRQLSPKSAPESSLEFTFNTMANNIIYTLK